MWKGRSKGTGMFTLVLHSFVCITKLAPTPYTDCLPTHSLALSLSLSLLLPLVRLKMFSLFSHPFLILSYHFNGSQLYIEQNRGHNLIFSVLIYSLSNYK